jgi:PAS domain S-box-containing protein
MAAIGFGILAMLTALFLILRTVKKQRSDKFDAAAKPMLVFDRETLRYLAVNQAASMFYGYTKAEFLSMTIKEIRPVWEVAKLQSHINGQSLYGKNTGTWKHQKKNGDMVLVSVTAEDIMFAGKQQRLVTIEDLTPTLVAHSRLCLR